MIDLDQRFAPEIMAQLAERVRALRRERGLSQRQLAERSGVSYGSCKRFEQTGEISLRSLVGIALALGCEEDFDALFSGRRYRSIEEVIADGR